MPSPRRLFKSFTDLQLEQAKQAIIDRMTNGQFTSLGGENQSSSKQYANLESSLFELNAEIDYRAGTVRPQRVEQRIFPVSTSI